MGKEEKNKKKVQLSQGWFGTPTYIAHETLIVLEHQNGGQDVI